MNTTVTIAVMLAAAAATRPLGAATGTAGLTFESDGATIRISNTNAVLNNGNSSISDSATLTIPDNTDPSLTAGVRIRLSSLDFGFLPDYGQTHARRISLTFGGTTYTSLPVTMTTNSTDKLNGSSGGSVDRLVYSFANTRCILVAGESYQISFLDASGNKMSSVRYKVTTDADSFISGVEFSSGGKTYRPLVQLVGALMIPNFETNDPTMDSILSDGVVKDGNSIVISSKPQRLKSELRPFVWEMSFTVDIPDGVGTIFGWTCGSNEVRLRRTSERKLGASINGTTAYGTDSTQELTRGEHQICISYSSTDGTKVKIDNVTFYSSEGLRYSRDAPENFSFGGAAKDMAEDLLVGLKVISSRFYVVGFSSEESSSDHIMSFNFGANYAWVGLTEEAGVIPTKLWNNVVAAGVSGGIPSGETSSAVFDNLCNVYDGMSLSLCSRGGTWCAGSASTGNEKLLFGYLDNSNGNGNNAGIKLTGVQAFAKRYGVYIYFNHDADDSTSPAFPSYYVNGTQYTIVDGILTKGDADWGTVRHAVPKEGDNVLVVHGLLDDVLEIKSPDTSAWGIRGTISAVQIVDETRATDEIYGCFSSTISGCEDWWTWIIPSTALRSDAERGIRLCGDAVTHDLGAVTPHAVSASVVAEVPSGAKGAVIGMSVANSGGETHRIYAYSKGDGSFSLGWDDKPCYEIGTAQKFPPLQVHCFALAVSAEGSTKGAALYIDGQKVASSTALYFTGYTSVTNVTFGNDSENEHPLSGMKVYEAATATDNGESIYINAENVYTHFLANAPSLEGVDDPAIRAAILDNYAKYGLTNGTVTLNGNAAMSFTESAPVIRLFGPAALDGVTFRVGGIDMSEGTIRLNVSPEVKQGNSLSVFGKPTLDNRWRRLVVNPTVDSVAISDFGDCRFFQLRAELGEKTAETYAVSETMTLGDSDNTESASHYTSSSTGAETVLFSLSLDGGTAGDYAASDYKTISFSLEGIAPGATATLATNSVVAATAAVGANGRVEFSSVPRLSDGITLSLGISMTNACGEIVTTNFAESAGVLDYAWGDGVTTNVENGAKSVVTMLANKPFNDKMDGSAANGWYRIPALAKATNGVVVALYDCRYLNSGDLPNSIDWAESVSTNNGATWGSPHVAVDVENAGDVSESRDITDPCILYDPAQHRFLAMGMTGGGLNSSYSASGAIQYDVALYTRAADSAAGWMPWGDSANQQRSVRDSAFTALKSANPNIETPNSAMVRILQGPGHGFVQRQNGTNSTGIVIVPKGSLVFPMQYFPSGNTANTQNFALYSTNGGLSWAATDLTPTNTLAGKPCYAQEGCIVELDDGTWEYMSKYGRFDDQNFDSAYAGDASDDARYECRLFFRTRDFKTWTFDGYHPSKSVRSQGSCLWLGEKVKAANGGQSLYASCFSTWGSYANSQRRGGLKLFFGRDTSSEGGQPGITWDRGEIEIRHEHTKACSYNSMAMLDDFTLGITFEACGHIYFRKVDVRPFLKSSGE